MSRVVRGSMDRGSKLSGDGSLGIGEGTGAAGSLLQEYFDSERGGKLDGRVWYPLHLFHAQTLLTTYPRKLPDSITRRRYYTYFMNLGEMMPSGGYRDAWNAALDQYPIVPYLDGQNDMYRWLHGVDNYVKDSMGEESHDALGWIEVYLGRYKPKEVIHEDFRRGSRWAIFLLVVTILLICIYYGLRG